jgi:hypothetical protein
MAVTGVEPGTISLLIFLSFGHGRALIALDQEKFRRDLTPLPTREKIHQWLTNLGGFSVAGNADHSKGWLAFCFVGWRGSFNFSAAGA